MTRKTRIVMLLLTLALAAQACFAAALAADEELEGELPGRWIYTAYTDEEGEGTADLAFLSLEADGGLRLRCLKPDGSYACTYEGGWSFELVPEGNDRLTLRFTAVDDPARAGETYDVTSVYDAYAEAWMENDTRVTYLILTPAGGEGVSPFENLYGEWEVALHREEGPNMRVVNCSSYVSLRQKPSKSSARLKKVPLGAAVFAFTEEEETNGFLRCVYQDEYGYILSEYLEPAEQAAAPEADAGGER